MAQIRFFLDKIDCEARKVWVDVHPQKNLSGKGIPLKTTQAFLKILWGLHYKKWSVLSTPYGVLNDTVEG